jgi:hypothetical protein
LSKVVLFFAALTRGLCQNGVEWSENGAESGPSWVFAMKGDNEEEAK